MQAFYNSYLSGLYNVKIADYDLKKNTFLKNYVKSLKNEQKKQALQHNIYFKRLDVNEFIRKNNTTDKMRKALVDLDTCYEKQIESVGFIMRQK